MKPKFERWKPIEGLVSKYDILDISIGIYGCTIKLYDIDNPNNKKVEIFFNHSVDALKIVDEAFHYTTIDYLGSQYPREFYAQWTFFKVYNSSYLQELKDGCHNGWDFSFRQHFCLITPDNIVDIMAPYEPKVKFIDYKLPTREELLKS